MGVLLGACSQQAPAGEITLAGTPSQGGLLFGTAPPGTTALRLDDRPVRLTGDRRFVVGMGREATGATVTAILGDGRKVTRRIAVPPRVYPVEAIPGQRASTGPSPEYEAIRAPELAAIAAARAGTTTETGWSQAFAWPVNLQVN